VIDSRCERWRARSNYIFTAVIDHVSVNHIRSNSACQTETLTWHNASLARSHDDQDTRGDRLKLLSQKMPRCGSEIIGTQ